MTTHRSILSVRSLATGLMVGSAIAGLVGAGRYRRDMRNAATRLAAVSRKKITTPMGDVEYVDHGEGEPLLLSHGIFQSSDAAFLLRDLFGGRRVISPSRFGYLGSTLPPAATPADQADAFVALLDSLGIAVLDVVGISAGATSTLQLALRHPERVRHLVVLSGNLPGSPTAVVQPSWARILNRQLPMWVIKTMSPSTMAFLSGVPKGLPMGAEDRSFVTEFMDNLFPVTPKVEGVSFDAFVSNADVNSYGLEGITTPTLLVHAEDDPLVSYQAAQRAAERIPGAHLLSLESGGHLLLGQTDRILGELRIFLSDRATA